MPIGREKDIYTWKYGNGRIPSTEEVRQKRREEQIRNDAYIFLYLQRWVDASQAGDGASSQFPLQIAGSVSSPVG
eukprot:1270438-Rhodomonas_salina.1